MLISDWSSDVCSSDLGLALVVVELPRLPAHGEGVVVAVHLVGMAVVHRPVRLGELELPLGDHAVVPAGERSEERRAGKESVRPCGSRWSPTHYKTTKDTIGESGEL